jgi:hypothetical protein
LASCGCANVSIPACCLHTIPGHNSALSSCKGTALDAKGACCDFGRVDACGVCNGTGTAVDAYNSCCTGALDAAGLCCPRGTPLDECGVCNGTSACPVRLQLLGHAPQAGLYLAPNGNANRKLRATLQQQVAAAIARQRGSGGYDRSVISVSLWAVGGGGEVWSDGLGRTRRARGVRALPMAAAVLEGGSMGSGNGGSRGGGSGDGSSSMGSSIVDSSGAAGSSGNATGPLLVDVLIRGGDGTTPPGAAAATAAAASLLGHAVPCAGGGYVVLRALRAVLRVGDCGNGVCEVGERVATDDTAGGCPTDCAFPFLACPPFGGGGAGAAALTCGGHGMCFSTLGACSCFTGYAGAGCGECSRGFRRAGSRGAYCVAEQWVPTISRSTAPCAGAVCSEGVPAAEDVAAVQAAAAQRQAQKRQGEEAGVIGVTVGCIVLVVGMAGLTFWGKRRALQRNFMKRWAETNEAVAGS